MTGSVRRSGSRRGWRSPDARGGDESLLVWRGGEARADDPDVTFDPIKVGPDTCSGCESTAVFVVDGQAAVYSLEGCDDDWCFYENPQGIA